MKLIYGMFLSGYLMTASAMFKAIYFAQADELLMSEDYGLLGMKFLTTVTLFHVSYIVRRTARKWAFRLCVVGVVMFGYSLWSAGQLDSLMTF